MNERSVLEIVLREGAISRAELARATGLSKPTISLALSRLEEAGLLREVGRTSGNRGATALLYDLDPSSGHVHCRTGWPSAAQPDRPDRQGSRC
jgi:DNA-binding transcriptional ArsR family regulator